MEFSKRIFIGVSGLVGVVTVYAGALMWVTRDTSALPVLITAVFAEFATATGYYYNKAKHENLKKIGKGGVNGDDF